MSSNTVRTRWPFGKSGMPDMAGLTSVFIALANAPSSLEYTSGSPSAPLANNP